ncbi:SAP30-binding protein-like [Garra rufa]|uniref:SAP30-binding protein-like n=1 Tax=Garra rufa TaxID=137080 RepID=UPI003CCE92A5
MASSKKNAVLTSLAAYGNDSEQDSDPDTDDQESHGGLVSASYGDDDVSRVEEPDEKPSENEDSDDDSTRNSEEEESDSGRTQDDVKDITEVEVQDPNELVGKWSLGVDRAHTHFMGYKYPIPFIERSQGLEDDIDKRRTLSDGDQVETNKVK